MFQSRNFDAYLTRIDFAHATILHTFDGEGRTAGEGREWAIRFHQRNNGNCAQAARAPFFANQVTRASTDADMAIKGRREMTTTVLIAIRYRAAV